MFVSSRSHYVWSLGSVCVWVCEYVCVCVCVCVYVCVLAVGGADMWAPSSPGDKRSRALGARFEMFLRLGAQIYIN